MGKKGDLSDFQHGMVVGARWTGLSVSETVDLLGFSHTTISRIYKEIRENPLDKNTLFDARRWRRIAGLI